MLYRSDWTAIAVAGYSEETRDRWLKSLASAIQENNREIVTAVIPSLLAWPDAKALSVLLKVIPADKTQCANFDCIRLASGIAALAWFDEALLRAHVPTERLHRLCPPSGTCP